MNTLNVLALTGEEYRDDLARYNQIVIEVPGRFLGPRVVVYIRISRNVAAIAFGYRHDNWWLQDWLFKESFLTGSIAKGALSSMLKDNDDVLLMIRDLLQKKHKNHRLIANRKNNTTEAAALQALGWSQK